MMPAVRRILGGPAFLAALAAAALGGLALYALRGIGAVEAALSDQLGLLAVLAVMVPAVLLLSAIVQVLMPRGLIQRWLGVSSGARGIAVATFAGAFTPGGPFMAFPLVRALWRAGADWPPLIAYVTAWLLLSVVRTLVFEIPFVGIHLPALRYTACLILPAIAGLAARYITRVYPPPPDDTDPA